MDAEICTKCLRTITSAEQVVVLDGQVVCARCALQHRPVEVQKRYIPPPSETGPHHDPWMAIKRKRRRRSGGVGLFRRRAQALALLFVFVGTVAYMFRTQLETIIGRHDKSTIRVPTSVEPQNADWGPCRISIADYGWLKSPLHREKTSRQFGVVLRMTNRSEIRSVSLKKRAKKSAEVRLWFRVHGLESNFWNRLWRSVTGAKPQWTPSPWVHASVITRQGWSKLPQRKSALAADHAVKLFLRFAFPTGRACSWVEMRLVGQHTGSPGTVTFRLPMPHAIGTSGRP